MTSRVFSQSQAGSGAYQVVAGHRAIRNTHPQNPKGAAASLHNLPWHQVQVPRGVQSQRKFRVGSGGTDVGLRHVGKINAPLPVPAAASLLHSRPAIHYAKPGTHLALSHAPARPTCQILPPPPVKQGSLQPVPLRAAEHSATANTGLAGHVTAPAGSPITCSEVLTTSGSCHYVCLRLSQLQCVEPRVARKTLESLV